MHNHLTQTKESSLSKNKHKYIQYKYFGKKDLSWDGEAMYIFFQIDLHNREKTCLYNVKLKKDKLWSVVYMEQTECKNKY